MNKEDQDRLTGVLLPFARQCLEKYGEFYPFAAYIDSRQDVKLVDVAPASDQPRIQELLESFIRALREKIARGDCRAAGLCFDVKLENPQSGKEEDAICMALEDGRNAVNVVILYRKQSGGGFQFDPEIQQDGEAMVWEA